MSNESPTTPAQTTPTAGADPADAVVPPGYPVDADIIEYFQREGQAGTTEARGSC